MHSAVIVFTGSNCVTETERFLQSYYAESPAMVWHSTYNLPDVDLYVIPGGFSYGDYLRAGVLASISPVLKDLKKKAHEGKKILGICNGFQILCEAGLLPGTLRLNESGLFICIPVEIKSSSGDSYVMPIAHGEGNYYHPNPENLNVALTYEKNPNGSVNNIAGVFNKENNVLGMMPHPERASEDYHVSQDGYKFLQDFIES